ncbi:alpha/beta hydrolase [Planococcus ruber]|nr:alpha/beta hydrolase [Planococcus ruber]
MVFLHGGGVSSWMWDKQIQYFTDYHCITIDLPEQGRSKSTEYFSIRKSAEDISKLIEKLASGKKIIVVGFSLGAQVLIQMLSMNPSLIHSAIINSALVRPNEFVRKMIRPSIKITLLLVKNRHFSKLQSKILYIEEEYFEEYYKESSQMSSATLIRILEENMSFKIPDEFDKTRSKVLVTVGEKEKGLMKKSASDIVSKNPNCVGIIMPGVGHGISLVNPSYFNLMLKNWLEKNVLPHEVISIR